MTPVQLGAWGRLLTPDAVRAKVVLVMDDGTEFFETDPVWLRRGDKLEFEWPDLEGDGPEPEPVVMEKRQHVWFADAGGPGVDACEVCYVARSSQADQEECPGPGPAHDWRRVMGQPGLRVCRGCGDRCAASDAAGGPCGAPPRAAS
jgi:hypothetical protein